jgi:hypothetical protein
MLSTYDSWKTSGGTRRIHADLHCPSNTCPHLGPCENCEGRGLSFKNFGTWVIELCDCCEGTGRNADPDDRDRYEWPVTLVTEYGFQEVASGPEDCAHCGTGGEA